MPSKKETALWQGHPVRDEEHARDLDLRAAIYTYYHGLDRAAAEARVKHEDRVERHQRAAAHHLDGLRAANAVGNHEDAERHHTMYGLHVKALGGDPIGAVPSEVKRWQGDKEKKHAYTFKASPDDQFLVQPVQDSPAPASIAKSEPIFEVGKYPSAPKYGHLRIVKSEDWPHVLSTWTNLAKADGGEMAQGRVKQFDVRKTWLRHKHTPEEQAYDYSSWLTPEQNQNGYKMFVLSHGPGNPVRAHVVHNQQKAASASGNVQDGDLEVENYSIAHPAHENRGLEAAALNALMGHAKSKMGADYLSHAPFTPEAAGFLEAVAKPHGLELGDVEDIGEGETPVNQPLGRLVTGGVKVRSKDPQRVPHSFMPRIPRQAPRGVPMWWTTENEQGDF